MTQIQGPLEAQNALAEIASNNAQSTALTNLGAAVVMANVATLRANTFAWPNVYLSGYTTPADGGEGTFHYVASDTTSSDNGGTVIVDTTGRRWHRLFSGPINLLWFCGNTVSDYSSGLAAAVSAAGGNPIVIPPGTFSSATSPSAPPAFIAYDANFTGAEPINAWEPAFGGQFHVFGGTGADNAIVGSVQNTMPANTADFPTGVTGYGRTNNPGNTAFGVFGRADLYNTGVALSEFDSFNFGGTPSATFPPNLAFGTTDYVATAILAAAYGTYASKAGITISYGTQQFLAGIYMDGRACQTYGLFIDADGGSGPTTPALIRGLPASVNLTLQTIGTAVPENAVLQVLDQSNDVNFAVKQNGKVQFVSTIVATSATAGSAGALPSTPANYLEFEVFNGTTTTTYKIPYYNL
jgi:hypothetical protein